MALGLVKGRGEVFGTSGSPGQGHPDQSIPTPTFLHCFHLFLANSTDLSLEVCFHVDTQS